MSRSSGTLAMQDMFSEFNRLLQESQTSVLQSWHNPFEITFNTFQHATDLASATMDQLFRNQHDTIRFLNPLLATDLITTNQEDVSEKRTQRIRTQLVAVVTGGIGGIGTEICKSLYEDGHDVIATCIPAEVERAGEWQNEQLQAGYEIDIIECDVTDYEACRTLSKTVERKYRRIDILVNCAGITRDATLRKMQPEEWHAVMDTNLDSVFNVSRNFINLMVKRKYGRIINISSVNGQKGQFGQTNYAAAKAGIIGFSKALALEFAESGITVNTVCPGYVGTSMVEAIRDDIKNSIISRIPVRRLARPAEIADVVSFLAAENSAYITGSEIAINGGLFTGVA